MDTRYYDVETVKERLEQYVRTERDIDNQIERLELLTSKMDGLGSQVLSDMPRGHNTSRDRFGDVISQKEMLENLIRSTIKRQNQERRYFEEILSHLRNPDEKAVIRMRYFDRLQMDEIAGMMFGHKRDFDDRLDTYVRRCYRVRSDALVHMVECIETYGDPDMAIPKEA